MKLDELACGDSVSVRSPGCVGLRFIGWRIAATLVCALVFATAFGESARAINLPSGFVDEVVVSGIESPAGFEFAPDGRLFFSERINGLLRTATYDEPNDEWIVEPIPYAAFDVPVDGSGFPEAHRSSGVRDFAFDPDFAANGFVYVFYMKHNPRHNRVVRIQQNPSDPRVALSGETLLLNLPFNSTSSSGSHNGGAVEFGADGTLFVATGDGWNGGDGVQSLATYTGKLFRIMPDGSIPIDNPFYAEAVGPLRAIYALGLRNPYSTTFNPISGSLYVNEANGANKTTILLAEPGANYGHQGYGGVGESTGDWHNSSITGGSNDKLITGGTWNPGTSGALPAEYSGSLFVCHWGSNGSAVGVINSVASETDLTTQRFAENVAKPVGIRIGPDGNLYYMDTTYETSEGAVHRIRFNGQASAATPEIAPAAGTYFPSVLVSITTATAGADIHYTLDGSEPTEASPLYGGAFVLASTALVRARAFAAGLDASGVAGSEFVICADPSCNLPPVANAGADRTVVVGQQAFLSGSASYDPDTDELLLSDSWQQVGGPQVVLLNDDETVAYFTPDTPGCRIFEYEIADDLSSDSDTVEILAVPCLDGYPPDLVAEWGFDTGEGEVALETAAGANHGAIDGASWTAGRTADAGFALDFDGVDDAVDLGTLDVDSGEITLSAWVQIDDFGQMDGRILTKADGVQEDDHIWMLSTIAAGGDHVLRFRLRTGGNTTTLIASGTELPVGVWLHAAATYDGSTMRLWQDGAEIAQVGKSGTIDTDPTMQAAIGNQPARDRPFDGRIDDVRIFDRALGSDEIARLASFYRPFDIDQDGAVTAADEAAFPGNPVDLNGDGAVDAEDEACLTSFFAQSCEPTPTATATAVAPTPTDTPTQTPTFTPGSQECGNAIAEGTEACDDGQANGTGSSCCTVDCQFEPDGPASCDGNSCTRADTCTAGVCSPGPCADGNACSACGGTCVDNGSSCDCE